MRITTIIIILIIIISLIIGVVYLYYNHEKPLQENKIINRDVNIKIVDFISNKNIVVNYTISLSSKENIYRNGSSLKNDYIVEKLPENNTFFISTNILNDVYYNDFKQIDTYENRPFRIDLELVKRGNLSIEYDGDFGSSLSFNLTLSKDGEVRNLVMCYVYSTKIIALYKNLYLEEITKNKQYQKYYKCFKLPDFNTTVLEFNYLYFNKIDKDDYIDFLFYDSDEFNDIHKEFHYKVGIG